MKTFYKNLKILFLLLPILLSTIISHYSTSGGFRHINPNERSCGTYGRDYGYCDHLAETNIQWIEQATRDSLKELLSHLNIVHEDEYEGIKW